MDRSGLIRDGDLRQRIPVIWQLRITEIIRAFIAGNFALAGLDGVRYIEGGAPAHIANAIANYGAVTLAEPVDETWARSEVMWAEEWWEVYVDLHTVQAGRSDLVLHLFVDEGADERPLIEVFSVYVP